MTSLGFAIVSAFLPWCFWKAEVCFCPSRLLLRIQVDVDGLCWRSWSIHLLGSVSRDVLGGLPDIPGLGGVLLVGRFVPGGGSLVVLVVPRMGYKLETAKKNCSWEGPFCKMSKNLYCHLIIYSPKHLEKKGQPSNPKTALYHPMLPSYILGESCNDDFQ